MSGRSRVLMAVLCTAGLFAGMAAPARAAHRGPSAVGINFDDVSAPCAFSDTQALRAQYASKGVLFFGPSSRDGGGILNACGGFGVTGYSAPNFLAFSPSSNFSDGGFARPPEGILFRTTVSHVGVLVGSGVSSGTVTMTAYDASHHFLASKSVSLQSQMHSLTLSATGIAVVKIESTGTAWVLDDLVAA